MIDIVVVFIGEWSIVPEDGSIVDSAVMNLYLSSGVLFCVVHKVYVRVWWPWNGFIRRHLSKVVDP